MANPNPSPGTQFGPGNKANPSGKSSELQRLEREAAEMAARLRHRMLSGLTEKAECGENAADLLTSDVLRLLKDSEDRAHGTPKQSVEHSSDPDKPLTIIERRIVKADD